jgi:hypothetical protein
MSTRNTQLTVGANDQRRLAIRVETAAIELADKTQLALLEVAPPIFGEGVAPPDLRAQGQAVAHWLAWRRQQLEAAEAVYARELRADQRLRAARDEARDGLIEALRVVQVQLDLALGKGRSASFTGFGTGLQLIETDMLMRIAEQTLEELRQGELGQLRNKSGQPAMPGLADLIARIEAPLAELSRVLGLLPASLLQTEAALEAKRSELDQLTLDTRRLGRLLSAGFRVAGLEFHADRLRPRARTTGGSEEEEELPPDAALPEVEVKAAANDTLPAAVAS